LVVSNKECFSSEQEDGGGYMPPDLFVEIKKGNLYAHYGHGRYGYWEYTFRFRNSDFELIGYDESNGGAIIQSTTSINFLTKNRVEKINVKEDPVGGDEIFKTTLKKIKVAARIKLSGVKDFDDLDIALR
jgi:hypothetical protein